MVEARHGLAGRLVRHAARARRVRRGLSARVLRRRLHDEPAARTCHGREGLDCLRLRRRAARGRARRTGENARATPLLLEEREMYSRLPAAGRRRTRVLGIQRLPHPRRPVAGTAVRGRLTWLVTKVTGAVEETSRVRTLLLEANGWQDHRAGQHLDVRLTAPDGYQAERSYSIASAPGEPLAITVERLEDGEVSPYLVDEVRDGDRFEVRGPIGGYFVW